jgi:pilus assembly protein Flp/PilA
MTRALIALRTRLVSTDRESGATAVEYGLMVSLIAVAIIGTVTILGTTLSGLFTTVTGSL